MLSATSTTNAMTVPEKLWFFSFTVISNKHWFCIFDVSVLLIYIDCERFFAEIENLKKTHFFCASLLLGFDHGLGLIALTQSSAFIKQICTQNPDIQRKLKNLVFMGWLWQRFGDKNKDKDFLHNLVAKIPDRIQRIRFVAIHLFLSIQSSQHWTIYRW